MRKHVKCSWCLSVKTKRNGKRIIRNRQIQRFLCLDCGHSFTKRINKGILTKGEKINITHTHLAGRTSIRQIVRDTGFAKQTIQNAIHETVKECANSLWVAEHLNPSWGNYLAIDGTYIRVWDWSARYFRYSKEQKRRLHKLVWLVALDLETLDIVHHHLGDEETMIDLTMFYEQIKENGYDLKGLVSDGNTDIIRSARNVFGNDVAHQSCISHFLKNLRVKLSQELITEEDFIKFTKTIKSGREIEGLPKELFTYKTTSLPKTNQQIENLFRQAKLRVRSIGQFHSHQTAEDYLNAWTLFRRFTKFTDCKDRSKNKKAPLELAGVNINGLNYLDLKSNLFLGR